jgi:hypothetical protein
VHGPTHARVHIHTYTHTHIRSSRTRPHIHIHPPPHTHMYDPPTHPPTHIHKQVSRPPHALVDHGGGNVEDAVTARDGGVERTGGLIDVCVCVWGGGFVGMCWAWDVEEEREEREGRGRTVCIHSHTHAPPTTIRTPKRIRGPMRPPPQTFHHSITRPIHQPNQSTHQALNHSSDQPTNPPNPSPTLTTHHTGPTHPPTCKSASTSSNVPSCGHKRARASRNAYFPLLASERTVPRTW